MAKKGKVSKTPVLVAGRSRGARLHYLRHREEGKTVTLCKARISTKPLFYAYVPNLGLGPEMCGACERAWAEPGWLAADDEDERWMENCDV